MPRPVTVERLVTTAEATAAVKARGHASLSEAFWAVKLHAATAARALRQGVSARTAHGVVEKLQKIGLLELIRSRQAQGKPPPQ